MLDPFYLIVDDFQWIDRLVPLGVRLVQLRIKDRSEQEIRKQVRLASALCRKHGAQLIVNDYWKIAIEEGCNFVHLGQEDLEDADLPAIREAGVQIGVSTHSETELDRALAVQPDYVALGPVYPTILKKMPWAPQGLERVREWKKRVGETALVAIGGLTVERVPGVLAMGADQVAVVTDISLHADPEARTLQWIEATR